MKETVSGSIARMGQNQKSFILQEQDGKWFGAFAVDQLQGANLGDKVQFFYESVEKNGRTFNNIKGNVSLVSKTSASNMDEKQPSLPRERLILRQNALTNAVNFLAANPMAEAKKAGPLEEGNHLARIAAVLETASQFEAWTSGDSDMRSSETQPSAQNSGGDPSPQDWSEAAASLKQAS